MFIPIDIVKKQNFKKAYDNTKRRRVFRDKIVDSARSPILYNIEVGRAHVNKISNGPFSATSRTRVTQNNIGAHPLQSDRGVIAREMLRDLGLTIDFTRDKNYSLKTEQAFSLPLLPNPNLVDWGTLNASKLKKVSTEYAFKDSNDPFYATTLDVLDVYNPRKKYAKEQSATGKYVYVPDTSKIAANLTEINLSNVGTGKSKYFKYSPITRSPGII
jgi:hypothetical protein